VASNFGSSSHSHHDVLTPESGVRASSHLTTSSSDHRGSLSPHFPSSSHFLSSDTSGTSFSPAALTPSSGEGPRLASSTFATDASNHQNMRRSDSWWARFSRTSFLDRRSSTGSRPVTEFRDPNPPPRLRAIEESMHSTSPEHVSPESANKISPKSTEPVAIYNAHNKSLTSVKTADTAAIERLAGSADVQMTRSRSRFSTASDGTEASSFQERPMSWAQTISEDGDDVENQQNPPSHSSHGSRVTGGTKRSYPPDEAEEKSNRSSERTNPKSPSMSVRLVQRPSLFVANPDHSRLPTSDSV
jgi:hypothetical protein